MLEANTALPTERYPVPEWPLALHRHYSRREIAAAVGYVHPGKKGGVPQGGILKLDGQRELLLVTLDKSARSFSPTTRYRDYAISPTLFHWETQSVASVSRPSGKRYIESPGNGWTFYLFAAGGVVCAICDVDAGVTNKTQRLCAGAQVGVDPEPPFIDGSRQKGRADAASRLSFTRRVTAGLPCTCRHLDDTPEWGVVGRCVRGALGAVVIGLRGAWRARSQDAHVHHRSSLRPLIIMCL